MKAAASLHKGDLSVMRLCARLYKHKSLGTSVHRPCGYVHMGMSLRKDIRGSSGGMPVEQWYVQAAETRATQSRDAGQWLTGRSDGHV